MKKNFWAQIWSKGANISPETRFFTIFSKFGSLVSIEIAYSDSLQQFLTCSRGKIHENKLWGPNLGPRLGFLPFSQIWFISFPENCLQ